MVHEYVEDPAVLAGALASAHAFLPSLSSAVTAIRGEAGRRGWQWQKVPGRHPDERDADRDPRYRARPVTSWMPTVGDPLRQVQAVTPAHGSPTKRRLPGRLASCSGCSAAAARRSWRCAPCTALSWPTVSPVSFAVPQQPRIRPRPHHAVAQPPTTSLGHFLRGLELERLRRALADIADGARRIGLWARWAYTTSASAIAGPSSARSGSPCRWASWSGRSACFTAPSSSRTCTTTCRSRGGVHPLGVHLEPDYRRHPSLHRRRRSDPPAPRPALNARLPAAVEQPDHVRSQRPDLRRGRPLVRAQPGWTALLALPALVLLLLNGFWMALPARPPEHPLPRHPAGRRQRCAGDVLHALRSSGNRTCCRDGP